MLRQLILYTGLALTPAAAWPQAPDSCSDIAARVAAAAPEPSDLDLLLNCPGERGPALASYLRSLRTQSDLNQLMVPFGYAHLLRDGEVFTALKDIAADAGAVDIPRNLSLRALAAYERGSVSITYEDMTSIPAGGVCDPGRMHVLEPKVIQGTPLPADYTTQLVSLASQLESSGSTPASVKSAARCLKGALPADLAYPLPPPPPAVGSLIELTYVCLNEFGIRNRNEAPVQVTYEVSGSNERATLSVPGRTGTAPYAEITFWTRTKGRVTLYFTGVQVGSQRNEGTACPPEG